MAELFDANDLLRMRSGTVSSKDPLVGFLYNLMRDHLTTATVEEIVRNHVTQKECVYTNGWLALYAKDIAARLRLSDDSLREEEERL